MYWSWNRPPSHGRVLSHSSGPRKADWELGRRAPEPGAPPTPPGPPVLPPSESSSESRGLSLSGETEKQFKASSSQRKEWTNTSLFSVCLLKATIDSQGKSKGQSVFYCLITSYGKSDNLHHKGLISVLSNNCDYYWRLHDTVLHWCCFLPTDFIYLRESYRTFQHNITREISKRHHHKRFWSLNCDKW